MKKTLILIISLFLLVSFSAGRDFDLSGNAGVAINPKWDTSFNFGIIGSTPFNDKIVAEAEFFFYLNAQEDWNVEGLTFSSYAWDLNLYGLYFFNLGSGKIKPYAALGAGIFSAYVKMKWDFTWSQGEDSDTTTKFNFGFGGGAKYPLNEKSGLRFDVRYIVILGVNGDVVRITAGYYMKLK